ncbi:hypothetical protein NPIL_364811 [Nephila pilipes]|uniref:Uncharacterized protein n=1 Tax=Nephila pilipes TaxID=299642 RepID=A0A8X6KQF5_NEPPI|nr:hypothetical protein NPIL_364811 [Nephila pilipes]
MLQDRGITITELIDKESINTRSVHFILTENLDLRKISAKLVLLLLIIDPKFSGHTATHLRFVRYLPSRYGSLGLLDFPKLKIHLKGTSLQAKRGCPALLPPVAESLEEGDYFTGD